MDRLPDALPRVLCVDDEGPQLEGLTLMLGARYDVHTARSGEAALAKMAAEAPFAVVIADNIMPGMSGAEFLQLARERHRDTIRVLLTGHSDLPAAITAVNRGNLFRFLLKPSSRETLLQVLAAAVEQHELQLAERQLLQQTLLGSIRALQEVLGVIDPVSFGRVSRLRDLALGVADRLGLAERWQLEYAALVSQLGFVSLPDGTLKRVHSGVPLLDSEIEQLERASALTRRIVGHIPRLGKVEEILRGLSTEERPPGEPPSKSALILKAVSAYESMERGSLVKGKAIAAFTARKALYDPAVTAALLAIVGEEFEEGDIREVPFERLAIGMTVVDDVYTRNGALLMPRGTRITDILAARIENVAAGSGPVAVRVTLAA